MSLNKVMLIGNVGKDPDVRYLDGNMQNGQQTKVATFTLATTERYRDRNGEQRENTEWHNIVVWRGLADIAEKYVRKGTQVYVEGKLRTRSWNDQQGVKHYTTEIVADTFQLLGRKTDNQAQGAISASGTGYPQPQGGNSFRQPSFQGPQPADSYSHSSGPQIAMEEPSDDLPF